MNTPTPWTGQSSTQMTNDWQNLFRGRKAGDIVDFAGGKMQVAVNGDPTNEGSYSGLWTAPDGTRHTLKRTDQTWDQRANISPAMADYLYNNYGYLSGPALYNSNIASGGVVNPHYGTAAEMVNSGQSAPSVVAGVYNPQTKSVAGVDNWMAGSAYNNSLLPQDFNWQRYVGKYADLSKAGIDTEAEARRHYANYGIKENRTYMSPAINKVDSGEYGQFGVGGSVPKNPMTTTAKTPQNAAMVDALRQKPMRFEGLGMGLGTNAQLPKVQTNVPVQKLMPGQMPNGLFSTK